MAIPTKDELIQQYLQPSDARPVLPVNPLYYFGRQTPSSHIVTSVHYDVMILDGIDPGYVERSLEYINSFYQFTIIQSDSRAYQDTPRLVVIARDTYTHGTGGKMVRVWISQNNPPTEQTLGRLIEHECDHEFGDPHSESSVNITTNYTNASKTWGTVTCTRISGAGTVSWTVRV